MFSVTCILQQVVFPKAHITKSMPLFALWVFVSCMPLSTSFQFPWRPLQCKFCYSKHAARPVLSKERHNCTCIPYIHSHTHLLLPKGSPKSHCRNAVMAKLCPTFLAAPLKYTGHTGKSWVWQYYSTVLSVTPSEQRGAIFAEPETFPTSLESSVLLLLIFSLNPATVRVHLRPSLHSRPGFICIWSEMQTLRFFMLCVLWVWHVSALVGPVLGSTGQGVGFPGSTSPPPVACSGQLGDS